ncbi:hypothetical protein [Prescottella subtropica]|uniref:hypothetical protein n=1 Tax=Prescottella subtropica TaxID=2545757 RepID=UPI0010F96DA3|nr:hypothetical protein [Prescottella subtropica]
MLSKHPESRVLVATSRLTPYLHDLAVDGTVDIAVIDDEVVFLSGIAYRAPNAVGNIPTPKQHQARGRRPWTRWAVERLLLLSERALPQKDIATRLGVTQQAVSLVLQRSRHIRKTPDGWVGDPRSELLDGYLAEYPGPEGASTYWYELDPIALQSTTASEFCARTGVATLQSGDVAADVYAPWRLPTRAVIYTRTFVDLAPAGFTPATEDSHTLEITVPADTTLWQTSTLVDIDDRPTAVVDPVIALHDVARSTGTDVGEAVEHLRTAIEERTYRA